MNIFVKQLRLPMRFVDIGIQQIHSTLRSVTSSNVSLNDRMNEYIHIRDIHESSSLSHNTHTACSLILMSTQCGHLYIGLVHSFVSLSFLIICVYNILFCFTLFHSTCVRTHSFSKQKHELIIGMYVCEPIQC